MLSPLSERATKFYRHAAADLRDLIHAWTSYREMTGNERNVELLAHASPALFGTISAALCAYSAVLISELLETSGEEGSASLQVLFSDAGLDVSARADLMTRLSSIRIDAQEVIEHGHRRRIHTAAPIEVESPDMRVPSRQEFQRVVADLRALMERFEDVARVERGPYEKCDGAPDVKKMLERIAAGSASG